MSNSLRKRIQELRQSAKNTRAYRMYRQALLYDTVRRHGKVLKRFVKLRRYLGMDYQCPICGVSLRAFKPIGKSYWRDIKKFGTIHPASLFETFNVAATFCPRCDASDRERLTAIYLERVFLALIPAANIGCSNLLPTKHFQRSSKATPLLLIGAPTCRGKPSMSASTSLRCTDMPTSRLILFCAHTCLSISRKTKRRCVRSVGCSSRTDLPSSWCRSRWA